MTRKKYFGASVSLLGAFLFFSLALIPAAGMAAVNSTPNCGPFTASLGLGDKGIEVVRLQQFLITQKYLVSPQTGSSYLGFGPMTKHSLQDWQNDHGLAQTGVTDVATRASLYTNMCGTPGCAGEGAFAGSATSCCSAMSAFDLGTAATAGARYLCYSPAKGYPTCMGGNAVYYNGGQLLKATKCTVSASNYVAPIISKIGTDGLKLTFPNGPVKLAEVKVLAVQGNCEPLQTSNTCSLVDYVQDSASCTVHFKKNNTGNDRCVMKFTYMVGKMDNPKLVAQHFESKIVNGAPVIEEIGTGTNLPIVINPIPSPYIRGNNLTVTWSKDSVNPNVDTYAPVSLSLLKGGIQIETQGESTGFYNPMTAPNTGSYSLTSLQIDMIKQNPLNRVPNGSDYQVRITASDGRTATTPYFAIADTPPPAKSLSLINPMTSVGIGKDYKLTWQSTGLSGKLTISVHKGTTPAANIPGADLNGTYSFTVPSYWPVGTDYVLKIKSVDGQEAATNFSVTAQ